MDTARDAPRRLPQLPAPLQCFRPRGFSGVTPAPRREKAVASSSTGVSAREATSLILRTEVGFASASSFLLGAAELQTRTLMIDAVIALAAPWPAPHRRSFLWGSPP